MNKIALALISSTLLIAAPAYAQEFTASQSVAQPVRFIPGERKEQHIQGRPNSGAVSCSEVESSVSARA